MATERTTPPNSASAVNAVTDSIKSTPGAVGSAGNLTADKRSRQLDYQPFLKEDIYKTQDISVENFLSWILAKELKQDEYADIINSSGFAERLKGYTKAKPPSKQAERALYAPFVEMANYCIQHDKIGCANMVFCRNDPIIVLGSVGQRKPDLAAVDKAITGKDKQRDVSKMSKEGPKGAAFFWGDLKGYLEFKPDEISPTKARATGVHKGSNKTAEDKKRKVPSTTELELERPAAKKKSSGSGPQTSTQSTGSSHLAPASAPQSGEMSAPGGRWTMDDEDHYAQCASYALEMLSNGGDRSHVIGALVSFNWLELLYYDHSVIVKSKPFNFVEDNTTFLAVLAALANLTPAQWGYAGLLIPPQPRLTPDETKRHYWRTMYKDHTLVLKNGWRLNLGDTLFRAHGLIGRGTVVVEAEVTQCPQESVQLKGKTVVVKWSWVPKTRTSEAAFIKTARNLAEQNNRPMLKHLPEVYCSEDFDHLTPECQRFLHENLENDIYEERILRVLVQKQIKPIAKINDPKKLAVVYKQIFECYRWLYEKARIFHRDISISNFMYHEVDGKPHGVLNDFDLAVYLEGQALSTSKQRTGTKPYMAIDLLVPEPPRHLYRHDLESFLYVLVFLTCETDELFPDKKSTLQQWADLAMSDLYHHKNTAITKDGFPSCKNGFTGFDLWILNMRKMFRRGFAARNDHVDEVKLARMNQVPGPPAFDDETLDGAVTWDKFAAAIAAKL